jgi:hypothetical protein
MGDVMNPTDRAARICGIVVLGVGIAALVLAAPLVGQQPKRALTKPVEKEPTVEPGKPSSEPIPIDAHFRDGSMLKVTLREEHIEIATPYGKLSIPATDIRRIDFGFHSDAATAKRIESAIAGLSSGDSKERETAAAALLDLGEHALPALVDASKSKDADIAQRAEAIITKLREKLSADRLEHPTHDVVETAECKITGRISANVFKVTTTQFGDQQVKLSDLTALGSKQLDPEALVVEQQLPFGGGPGMPVINGNGGVWVVPAPGGRAIRGGAPGAAQPRQPRVAVPGGVPLPGGLVPPPNPPEK